MSGQETKEVITCQTINQKKRQADPRVGGVCGGPLSLLVCWPPGGEAKEAERATESFG